MTKVVAKNDAKRYGVRKVIVREVISYPFTKWLAIPQRILVKGTDYGIDSVKMAQQIRNEASERGLSVSIKTRPHAISLTVWDHVKG